MICIQNIEHYLNELKGHLKEIDDLKEQVDKKYSFFPDVKESAIKCIVSSNILLKTREITKKMLDSHTDEDLLIANSSIRFILETLIVTKLMDKEDNYAEKIYYSLFNENKMKVKKVISRAELELKLLQEFDEQCKEELKDIDDFEKQSEVEEAYYKKFKDSITVFGDGIESTGFSFHQYLIKDQVLSKCEKDLEELNNEIIEILKKENVDIEDQSCIDDFFESKLDKRNWKRKAIATDLLDEYTFIYDYTSSLMHATSFSFLTPHSLSQSEISLIFTLYDQYLVRIIHNIKKVNHLYNLGFYNIS